MRLNRRKSLKDNSPWCTYTSDGTSAPAHAKGLQFVCLDSQMGRQPTSFSAQFHA